MKKESASVDLSSEKAKELLEQSLVVLLKIGGLLVVKLIYDKFDKG